MILQERLCSFLEVVYATHVLKSQHKYSRKKKREKIRKKRLKDYINYGEFQDHQRRQRDFASYVFI